jgi:exonuclease III
MKILAWNCRGLACAPTIHTLRALIRQHRPDVLFLSETKVLSSRFWISLSRLGFVSWLEVPPVGRSGGLFVTWKFGFTLDPVRLDQNHISCMVVSDPPLCSWLISCVYAPHTVHNRFALWSNLSELGNSVNGPWLLLGDFNAILSAADKCGGRSFGNASHLDFVDFVNTNALVDLGFVGNNFTWSNHQNGRANIRERLDRGLANQGWVSLFPNSLINHLLAANSDHCPILLSTTGTYQNLPKPFRFEAFWTRDQASHSVVAEAWLVEVEGSPAFSLSRKWKKTKAALKSWNTLHFGHIQTNIKALMAQIGAIQASPHSSSNSAREVLLQKDLQEQLLREEVLWKQKSRELWLSCTDLNTKFFHASTACRRRYNSISCLFDNGIRIMGRENIGSLLVDHFKTRFTTTHPPLDDDLSTLVDRVITVDENVALCVIPSEEEIFLAITDLGLNKAPGPDGMTGLFYKTYWPIVKLSVISAVQSFFRGGFLLKEFNHTNIALIPKVDNPSRVNQFRPISLTNFNYKIISKILANRFKPLLHKIVSPMQSAFLKGRSIHDNTILAHEVFHSMKNKRGNGGLMALKLDMEKAFDSMEWNFLLKILELLGFQPTWIKWISQCITTSSFSILLDGAPFGKFFPTRGLRQGDPLSPFLFILGSEILSRLLLREENSGTLHGIKIARMSPPISHLLFADDVMIFSKANMAEANVILKCLSLYSRWSGQCINHTKSSIFYSKNCKPAVKSSVNRILRLPPIPANAKYLGIPLFILRKKKDSFSEMKERILAKVTGWKAKLLSQAARTTLIKSVLNAIPTYIMSLFLIPKSLCAEIDSVLRKFWWGFPQEKKHNLSLLSWDSICKPKSLGGLGINSMEFINNSLLARLGWKLTSNAPLFWVEALKGKYLQNGISFLEAPSNPLSSWIWKGLLKNRKVVEKGACWSISNGENIHIWTSPWIPSLPNFKPRPNVHLADLPDFVVADLMLPGERAWNVDLLRDLFSPPTVSSILSIHIPQVSSADKWSWVPSPSGLFSVKSAREISLTTASRSSPLSPANWQALWGLKIQARLKHLLWKIAWDLLPSRANIGRFVISEDSNAWVCPFCKGPLETLSHIFLDCNLARFIWSNSSWPNVISSYLSRPIHEWILAIVYPTEKLDIPIAHASKFQIFAVLTMDLIWLSRNKLLHEALQPDPYKISQQLHTSLDSHLLVCRKAALPSLWLPPCVGSVKGNFDVAIKGNFAVAAAVLSDSSGEIFAAATLKLHSFDVLLGEASAALLATRLARSYGLDVFFLEGDALLVSLAVNQPALFSSWHFSSVISDICFELSSFRRWHASKVSRCANFRAHALAKWAATNHVFGSIPLGSPILSSIRIQSGKDPPL